MTTNQNIVALISIFGQLVKEETDGKWFLEKRYGTYNPKYEGKRFCKLNFYSPLHDVSIRIFETPLREYHNCALLSFNDVILPAVDLKSVDPEQLCS